MKCSTSSSSVAMKSGPWSLRAAAVSGGSPSLAGVAARPPRSSLAASSSACDRPAHDADVDGPPAMRAQHVADLGVARAERRYSPDSTKSRPITLDADARQRRPSRRERVVLLVRRGDHVAQRRGQRRRCSICAWASKQLRSRTLAVEQRLDDVAGMAAALPTCRYRS